VDRIPESAELMEGEGQAAAYARADFAQPNALFCEQLVARAGARLAGRAVDLGCGPADIPIRLALRHPELHVDAVDGSAAMLRWAERAVQAAALGARVRVIQGELGAGTLVAASYELVLSNSLLHHLVDPGLLWREVARLLRPRGFVQVMDLARPESSAVARAIVVQYASDEAEMLQHDFFASLCAAFTPEEVRAQVSAAGLSFLEVEMISDRHLIVAGRAGGDWPG
jgi:ubiquinone/menaquinone biosynthesis C-methylase UbiE